MLQTQADAGVVRLTEHEFWQQFKPVKNVINDDGSFNGCLFKTTDSEMKFVMENSKTNPYTIWTVFECDGVIIIGDGFQSISGLGYLVTEIPAVENTEYIVKDEEIHSIGAHTIAAMASIDMTDIVSYETPDEVPEWAWIQQNASYTHVRNAENGVWEFLLNLSRQFDNIPEVLEGIIKEAKEKRLSYLLFHQGT